MLQLVFGATVATQVGAVLDVEASIKDAMIAEVRPTSERLITCIRTALTDVLNDPELLSLRAGLDSDLDSTDRRRFNIAVHDRLTELNHVPQFGASGLWTNALFGAGRHKGTLVVSVYAQLARAVEFVHVVAWTQPTTLSAKQIAAISRLTLNRVPIDPAQIDAL